MWHAPVYSVTWRIVFMFYHRYITISLMVLMTPWLHEILHYQPQSLIYSIYVMSFFLTTLAVKYCHPQQLFCKSFYFFNHTMVNLTNLCRPETSRSCKRVLGRESLTLGTKRIWWRGGGRYRVFSGISLDISFIVR